MKKTTFVLFLVFIVTFSAKAQVVITVADNATLEIKNGAVKSFIEKPKSPKSNLAAAGIYIMNYKLFRFLSSKDIKIWPILILFFSKIFL